MIELFHRFVFSSFQGFLIPDVRSKLFYGFFTGRSKDDLLQVQKHSNQPDSIQNVIVGFQNLISSFPEFCNKRSGRWIHDDCFDLGPIQPLFQVVCIFGICFLFTFVSSGIVILPDAVPFPVGSFIPQKEYCGVLCTIVTGNIPVPVGLLENALSNTLQFIKQESTNDSYTSEEKREMKKDAVEFRNLQAKLAHFLKGVVSVK